MGRAIDVDKRLDDLEYKVNEILLILDELGKVNTTQEHIDLHEETKTEKTNDEGSVKVITNLIVENQVSQNEILKTQRVLSNYIGFKKDNEKFKKYLEELNGRTDKESSKRSPSEK